METPLTVAFSFVSFLLFFSQGAIAYLPLIMLVSATVSSGMSKKLVGIIGKKVKLMPNL